MWLARLRWRMRGAWQWPAFVVLTLRRRGRCSHALPFYGRRARTCSPGVLLAGLRRTCSRSRWSRRCVGRAAAPPPARPAAPDRRATTRARRCWCASSPRVARGRAGRTAGGARGARATSARCSPPCTTTCVAQRAARTRRASRRSTRVRLEDDRYRACVPGPRAEAPLCLFVNTDQSPAGRRRATPSAATPDDMRHFAVTAARARAAAACSRYSRICARNSAASAP